MSRKHIPPRMYCVRCGGIVELVESTSDEARKIREHGYTEMAKGVCSCGAVYIVCFQPLPASPTFSIFMNIYRPEDAAKIAKEILIKRS